MLSYSVPQKIEICKDLFSEDLTERTVIADDLKNESDSQHSLIVGRINSFVELYWDDDEMEDIFFKCSGRNLAPEYKSVMEYFVSSTFQHGFMYNGTDDLTPEDDIIELKIKGYIGLSPKFVSIDQAKLEEQYLASRRTISRLRFTRLKPSIMKILIPKHIKYIFHRIHQITKQQYL